MAHSMDDSTFLRAWPLAAPHMREIREIEAELSLIWPGWSRRAVAEESLGVRQELRAALGGEVSDALAVAQVGEPRGTPFAGWPMARVARIKYLLKRESLLRRGMHDWYVMIATNATGTACYAHPHQGPPPAGWSPPPKVGELTPERPEAPSATALAMGLRLPLEEVERAVEALGHRATPEAVRAWVGGAR